MKATPTSTSSPVSKSPDPDSEQREDSDPSSPQLIDDLLTLEDEALFAQARAAARSLLGLDIGGAYAAIRAGPESAVI